MLQVWIAGEFTGSMIGDLAVEQSKHAVGITLAIGSLGDRPRAALLRMSGRHVRRVEQPSVANSLPGAAIRQDRTAARS